MNAIIQNAPIAHRRTVKVMPIARHYETPNETPYIKYNCPVCTAVGNTNIQLSGQPEHCPLCGVALNWDRKPKVGDTVITTEKPSDIAFPENTVCVILEDHSDDPKYNWPYLLNDQTSANKWFYSAEHFSILEEAD